MKSIVLCEASYDDGKEKNENSFKLNVPSRTESAETENNAMSNCNRAIDMEIYEGSLKSRDDPQTADVGKEGSKSEKLKGFLNPDVNSCGEVCEKEGSSETCESDKKIELKCCIFEEEGGTDPEEKKLHLLLKCGEVVTNKKDVAMDRNSSSDGKEKSAECLKGCRETVISIVRNSLELPSADNVTSCSAPLEENAGKEKGSEEKRNVIRDFLQSESVVIDIESEESDPETLSTEVAPSKEAASDVVKGTRANSCEGEKVEIKNEQVEPYSTEKQASEEIFIEEEEENKENRGTRESNGVANSLVDRDGKIRRKENTDKCVGDNGIVNCLGSTWESGESLKSEWNEDKSEFFGSDENMGVNAQVESLFVSELNVEENDASDSDKNGTPIEGSKAGEKCNSIESKKTTLNVGGQWENGEEDLKKEEGAEEECKRNDAENEGNDFGIEKGSKSEKEVAPLRKRSLVNESNESVLAKRRKTRSSSKSVEVELGGRPPDAAAAVTAPANSNSETRNYGRKDCKKVKGGSNCDIKRNHLEESIDRVATARISLPFIESLRGTVKNLSRSDLEELIVQKLCEVITERSTVGDLRKKAQALEQDQERWKEKVHSLTKQIREMDMVMKKYISEVQKQNKERSFQMVAPLRVTRSVGLQVSFTSNYGKLSKAASNPDTSKMGGLQEQDKTVKQTVQRDMTSPNAKKTNFALLPTPQMKKNIVDPKKQFSPRPGVNVATLQTRLISPQTVVASNIALQTQANSISRPKPQVADQNNSKIIDLTEDDDRQSTQSTQKMVLQPSVTVRPPGPIRVVNHVQPTQVNTTGRVAYLVPATTATASGSGVSSRSPQLLIAAPTVQQQPRQILPSVPPLLYKGSTVLQPGAQQPAFINQPNRAAVAKPLKHPAPLPQPPLNQIQKPNWKLLPPRPALKISKVQTGIVLSWNMTLGPEYEPIASYQLYAYQENNSPPATSLWKKVGDVKALPLPMACTLTQFMSGHKYHFAVRAVDLHSRIGPFSFPGTIVLVK